MLSTFSKHRIFNKNVLLLLWGSLLLLLNNACKTYSIAEENPTLVKVQKISADSSILLIYQPYKEILDGKMKIAIGEFATDLTKEKPESTLGNFCAHVMYNRAEKYLGIKPDFSIVNYGGIRIPSMNKGVIKVEDIYKLMPFDNYVVIVELDGATTQTVIEKLASEGGWPVEGIRFKIKDNKPIEILIDGKPFDPSRNYQVAMVDYLANGGDKFEFLKGKPQKNSGVLFRDALIEYVKEETAAGRNISVIKDGRVQNAQ